MTPLLTTRGLSRHFGGLKAVDGVDFAVLPVADRVSFIENGRVRETVEVDRLRDEPELVKRYVGVS